MRLRGLVGVLCVCAFSSNLLAGVDTLAPCEDVCISTYGGGQGGNVFLKFDISGIVADTIDSVFLDVYVWRSDSAWDGDVKFCNVNSQEWSETTNINTIWSIPTSDTVLQDSGFGDTTGWTMSVDITPIFVKDYDSTNTYCSIKLKDPDDVTTVPQPFGFPVDDADTLAVGNFDYIFFYPHEHLDSIPSLIVHYAEVGVEETGSRLQIADYKLAVLPNPVAGSSVICYQLSVKSRVWLGVYDVSGRLLSELVNDEKESGSYKVCWDTRGISSGVYFVEFKSGNYKTTEKVILIK